MRVLVTGATGFVGKRLCAALRAVGHELVVLSRNSQSATHTIPGATVYPWNVAAEVPPLAAFNQVDAVIHLAGEGIANKRWSDKQKRKIYDSRIFGTRYLTKAMRELESAPKIFICASAIGYYGDRVDEPLPETSKPGTGFLALVCRDWEKEADGAPEATRTVKLRIGVVLGKEGGMLKKLLPLFRLALGGPVGHGRQWMSWVHVDDLVQLILHALIADSMKGIYNAVTPNPVTNEEFSKALGQALHRPAVFRAPAGAIRLAMGELSELVLASQKVIPQRTQEAGFRFGYPEISLALKEIVK